MGDIVVGIDLGTTNSCAAYYIDGHTQILQNKEGDRITPSVVYYDPKKGPIVGKHAKNMAIAHPKYAVFEIKRLVGRQIDDPYVQKNLEFFPFKVDSTSEDPLVVIEDSEKESKKSPSEVCAKILKKIKTDIEFRLEQPVQKAVITVPAYFNVKQREVTLEAAKLAGFTVLKLLNEPTAAALSFYSEKPCENEDCSLVFDLGGGTFDVAILKRKLDNIEIIGVAGDSHLGGQDFDNLIIDYVCTELKKRYNFDAKKDRRVMRRLHKICEDAKKEISVTEEATMELEGFVPDNDSIEITLKRTDFEQMASKLFEKTIEIVKNCLKIHNLSKTHVKEVILAGGSTRIPKIQQLLSEYFDGKTLNHQVNQDECVAEGAAIQAALLSTHPSQQIANMKITDVTSLSLGIGQVADVMKVLIKRNTPIPTSVTEIWTNVNDGQEAISLKIYEGERVNVLKNRFLGELEITDLTPAPPNSCQIIVEMSIDINGILHVSATEKHEGNVKNLKITYVKGHISDSEVKNSVKDAEDNKEEDEEFLKFAELKAYLIRYCIWLIYNFNTHNNLTQSEKNICDLCKAVQREAATWDITQKERLKSNIDNLKKQTDPIIKKYNFV